jgi:hypothetical protein
VEFGRGGDDGLGPRYIMPCVVAQAVGSAAILAPLFARLGAVLARGAAAFRLRFTLGAPALLSTLAALVGAALLVPRTYPVAYEENHAATAPLRGARDKQLQNAIVIVEYGKVPAHPTNLAQNAPFEPNPDVLYLIHARPSDDACARRNFPGRTWYRAGMDEKLTPY